ncbi:MAG: hypothetical protein E7058_02055 [Lentisphaerae bacterium]|nr:hypothetical protein [Lentisphaerota bacterium]
MKKLLFSGVLLLVAGCASSDRMFRMSGGVFDEYSVPAKSRIRSEKYQAVSRQINSPARANKIQVAGLDDTLVNIWPFFFRNNDYWTVLWPMIDKDPYGFAFRPFYNHEGDDYSVLFPLCAWNPAAGHGWVTLFGWNKDGFGFIPLTWHKKKEFSGSGYYTPLFFYSYDNTPFKYIPAKRVYNSDLVSVEEVWSRNELSCFAFLFCYDREVRKKAGDQQLLFNLLYDGSSAKSRWNYYFNGKKPFPATRMEFEKFRQEVFNGLPEKTEKSYGFLPLWFGSFDEDGDYMNRFMLLAGNRKSGKNFNFDILGDVIAGYEKIDHSGSIWHSRKQRSSFTSWVMLSHFAKTLPYKKDARVENFYKLRSLYHSGQPFAQKKPAILDALNAFDPAVKLPDTVVDNDTLQLFLIELRKKYDFPTDAEYCGRILPLIWYRNAVERSYCVLPPLLTWWSREGGNRSFTSLPLLTWVDRSKNLDKTIIFTPLGYYAKEQHRERSNYRILSREQIKAGEYECAELRDRYALCGLFYRGRFGFNVAKSGVDAGIADTLRRNLRELYQTQEQIDRETAAIAKERSLADRWQPQDEIERLRKLIRYEELKIRQKKLDEKIQKYRTDVDKAMERAGKIGFAVERKAFEKKADAGNALAELMENFTELRFYEDIGSGLFFNKMKYYNGDYKWHFLHILAGGEKNGSRESEHVLHLLYRYRKEGNRSERIFFPFISTVKDGENSRVSFLWRVFSLSKRDGRTGGYIFFIPFGDN